MPMLLIDINSLLKPKITGIGVYTGELVRYLNSAAVNGMGVGYYYNANRRSEARQISNMVGSERANNGFSHGLSYHCAPDAEFGRLHSRWVDLQSWFLLAAGKWRLFHATNIVLPPLPSKVRGIVTVHDLLFCRFPEFESPYTLRQWKRRVGQALHRADCIIAISESTASDIREFYGIDNKKIRVIYHGADDYPIRWIEAGNKPALRKRWNLPERFLLFVGTLSVHKNVINAMKAFVKIADPELGLVIVGKGGNASEELEAFLKSCTERDRSRIHLYGYLEREELEAFYQLASIFLFPSLHEGFGLPVVEAMKRRLPVVTSDNSSLRELFRDSAVLVNPRDPEDIAQAVERLLRDESARVELIEKGEQKTREMTWKKMAEQTYGLYQSLL